MSIDFILPDIGEGIVECELVEWLVNEGEVIVEDQPVADVMTDKALVQIPAMYSGVIEKLYYKQGEIAKVHSPLFSMTPENEVSDTVAVSEPKAINEQTTTESDVQCKSTTESQVDTGEVKAKSNQGTTAKVTSEKALASPAVRRVARELNINIHQVAGSGKKGRVYKGDVVAYSQNGSSDTANTAGGGTTVESIRGIKKIMATAMQNSVSTIPHFTYCEEIDLTALITLRSELKNIYAQQDIKLTMMPFFMKAMSLALKEYPLLNSQVNDDCTELTYFNDHNIGMAVDTKVGLLVPNIKQVQIKSIINLANDITRLTADARSGRVTSGDLKGGTITISNIGAIGGTVATPIINKPEVAIVALGKVQKLPRFNEEGAVEARSIMQVSWSGDHRVIDGGTIARFCNLWKLYLEQPSHMLVHMS